MKKIVIFLAVAVGLILLLGLTGAALKSQDTESKCEYDYCAAQWRQNIGEYTIVRAPKLDKLQKAVNESLKESWYPIGGVSIVDSNCCQVMIK
jgi:hypothetical protein